jgi:ATP-binding cassette subfamily B protein
MDGVDVREIPLERLRGAIGFVPQEPFLFSDEIAENIAFGVSASPPTHTPRTQTESRGHARPRPEGHTSLDASLERRMHEAASIARLDKDVESFPKGYHTAVGERGITLSGGQKQRTALARAVMVDPRVLILDDALSAVDTYTEEEILSRLKGVLRQRTSIIVAHRISTVRDADQIFVLDRGRIVERGGHDALVARGGLYAALYRKQLLEEELAAS